MYIGLHMVASGWYGIWYGSRYIGLHMVASGWYGIWYGSWYMVAGRWYGSSDRVARY